MGRATLLLICYHLLLFRRFYFQNPYVYARSEALEQGFASSIFLGYCLRRHQMVDDPYYYPDYRALPFLSSFYPPHVIQAWLGSFLTLDEAWLLYSFTMVLHFAASSIGILSLCYHLPIGSGASLFAAMTLSSLGYAMKQNSCINYTVAWVPILLLAARIHSWGVFGTSVGFMLLAGYWPIALYAIPLGCCCWLLG